MEGLPGAQATNGGLQLINLLGPSQWSLAQQVGFIYKAHVTICGHFHRENRSTGRFSPDGGCVPSCHIWPQELRLQPCQKTLPRRGKHRLGLWMRWAEGGCSRSSPSTTTSYTTNGRGQTTGFIICANMTENHGLGSCHNPDLYVPFASFTTLGNYSDPPEIRDDRRSHRTERRGFVCITPSISLYNY